MTTQTAIISRSTTGVPSNYQRPFDISTLPPGFLPTQIPNCTLWLDATDTTGSSLNLSGTSVLNWFDKSGNNNTATAGAAKPTINYSAINGRPAISFTNTGTTSTSTFFTGSFGTTFTGSFLQAFVVATMSSSSGGNGRLFSLARPGFPDVAQATTTFPFCRNGGQNIMIGRNLTFLSVNIPAYDTPFIGQSSQNNGSQSIGLNGTLSPSSGATANSGAFNISNFGVGTNADTTDTVSYHSGFIGEVIYYTTQLTTAQIQQVEGYLAWKWGLTANLPPTHPYVNINQTAATIPTLPVSIRPTIFSPIAWTPRNISSLSLWMDASDFSTFSFSSGTSINTWSDKSGNGNTATSGTTKPSYLANSLNGLPTVSFTASASGVSASTYFSGSFSSAYTGFSYEALIVATMSSSSLAFGRLLSLGRATGDDLQNDTGIPFCRDNNTQRIFTSRGSDGAFFLAVTLPAYDTPFIGQASQIPSNQNINLNGGAISNASATPYSVAFNLQRFAIGTNVSLTDTIGSFTGNISEILFYTKQLTLLERQQAEGYLAWKWGLQGSLAAKHPFKNFPPL